MLEGVAHVQVDLRLVLAVQLVVVLRQTASLRHKLNLVGHGRLEAQGHRHLITTIVRFF